MSDAPTTPPADDKDWTWVLERPCAECGFDPATVDVRSGLDDRVTASAAAMARAVLEPGADRRPASDVWSPLEYGAHVVDVLAVFGTRVELLRAEDGVRFANWDQDTAALEGRYWERDPAQVAAELTAGAEAMNARFARLSDAEWEHRGLRSNGSAFTTGTLASYFLHDLEHHVHDVTGRAS